MRHTSDCAVYNAPAMAVGECNCSAKFAHGFHIFKDGNMWCAVGPHFRDLQQDNAGFGETPQHAYDEWWLANSRRGGFRTGWAKPDFSKFLIHGEVT